MAFEFDDAAEASDIVGTLTSIFAPGAEAAAKSLETVGYGGGGHGGGMSLYESMPASTPLSEGIGLANNVVGVGTGLMGIASGVRDMLDPENHWIGKKGLGALNAISGAIGTAGSVAGLAGAETGFFGGLAGATGTAGTATAAGIGATVSAAGSVAGAGLAGIGLGMYGDDHMTSWGFLDREDEQGRLIEKRSITDWASDRTRDAADAAEEDIESEGAFFGLCKGRAKEGSFRDYLGGAIGANTAIGIGALTSIGGAGLSLASTAHAAGSGLANTVTAAPAAIERGGGILPVTMNALGAAFGHFAD